MNGAVAQWRQLPPEHCPFELSWGEISERHKQKGFNEGQSVMTSTLIDDERDNKTKKSNIPLMQYKETMSSWTHASSPAIGWIWPNSSLYVKFICIMTNNEFRVIHANLQ